MSSIGSFSGLASGIQWRDMIDQIIKVESRPIELMRSRIDTVESRSSAWSRFQSLVEALNDAAEPLANRDAFKTFGVDISGVPSGTDAPFSVTAGSEAVAGTHQVRVLATATQERLGGAVFSSRTDALGLSGEFLINGTRIQVGTTDALDDLADRINGAGAGVTASVLSTDSNGYQLVLTSTESGADGINLSDGAAGVLRDLGFLDTATQIKHATSDGAKSDGFSDATTAVASVLGLSTPPAAGTVTVGGVAVNLDLSTMSLDDIAAAINTAAGAAGSSVSAQVVEETVDGSTVQRLDISGTTSLTDSNRILEVLGVLEGQRTSVAQQVQGAALTSGGAAATTATRFVDLDSGVQAGDTLTIQGTRGDGSTFSFDFSIDGTTTLQDLLDRLNSATDAFGAGSRTATASLSANGEVVVTDDQGGLSQLALEIVAHNEGGGTLDFGTFDVVRTGRLREIIAGTDAELEVDGTYVTRSTNRIDDVIAGLTFDLQSALPDTTVDVTVSQDVDGIVSSIKDFVNAYNELADFVGVQFGGSEEGEPRPPLSGNSVLRTMRSQLRTAMESRVASGIAGTLERMADVGIEINKEGRYTIDEAALESAIQSDPQAVARLFGVYGTGSIGAIEYVDAGDAAQAGTYAVNITQVATQADVTGAGFGGTYVDDGTADTLHIRDVGADNTYSISLSNGMTMDEIVSALNAEFATEQQHKIAATNALYQDAVGTAVDDSTVWADVYNPDGTSAGVANGDVITISGTRHNGEAFVVDYEITDVNTQTVGELRQLVQEQIGEDARVVWENGYLTVEARPPGSSLLTFSVQPDNAGGGSLSFGSVDVAREGRLEARMTAYNDGGQLRIAHEDYGSNAGFEVSYTAGGTDGSASLGLAAGVYTGQDVAGTIGGMAATGSGQLLTGADGTDVEGLTISYTGTSTGAVGDLTFSRGVADEVRLAADPLLGSDSGSISSLIDQLDERVSDYYDRIDEMEARLDRRRETLVRQFTAMEQALARAQTQSQWLAGQMGMMGMGMM